MSKITDFWCYGDRPLLLWKADGIHLMVEAMTEAELVQYFDYFLQNYQIQTQFLRRDTRLFMMLNRPADLELDYDFLAEAITEQLRSLPLDEIQAVILSSRVLKEKTPDWKVAISLKGAGTQTSAPDSGVARPATLTQVKATLQSAAAGQSDAASISSSTAVPSSTTESSSSAAPDLGGTSSGRGENSHPSASGRTPSPRRSSQSSSPQPLWRQILGPLVGICLVIAVLWVGISDLSGSRYCYQPADGDTPAEDRYHLCVLTSRMVGESNLPQISEAAIRLEEEDLEDLPYRCSTNAIESSGFSAFWGDPVGLNYRAAEVLPGVYTVDLEQSFRGGSREILRYGCVFQGTSAGDLTLVKSDFLPNNWPQTRYRPSADSEALAGGGFSLLTVLSMGGALSLVLVIILFILNVMITALSFFLIGRVGLGIQIYSLPDLLVSSLVFALWSGALAVIPGIGFLFQLALDVVALLLTDWLVKGFKVDYTAGYPSLMLSVLMLFGIRLIFWMSLAWAFGSWVMSLLM